MRWCGKHSYSGVHGLAGVASVGLGGLEMVCTASEPSWRRSEGQRQVKEIGRREREGEDGLEGIVSIASIRGLRWSGYHAEKGGRCRNHPIGGRVEKRLPLSPQGSVSGGTDSFREALQPSVGGPHGEVPSLAG